MAQARLAVTPWASWGEWEEVYAALFALDDPSRRAAGVRAVERWRSRMRVPVAVDATASLAEVAMSDAGAGGPSEHALCMMYAMTITRMVNGIVDPLQQGQRATSVQFLARELELPVMLVELRHECTHNRLPSLSTLRLAADQALLWLHQYYWQPQRAVLAEGPELIVERLHRFCEASLMRCVRGGHPQKQDLAALTDEFERCLNSLQLRTQLVASLLDCGFLAPMAGSGSDGDHNVACSAPAPTDAPATASEATSKRAPPTDSTTAWAPEVQKRLWLNLLARLQRRKPAVALGSALLVECVHRIGAEAAEAGADPGGAAPNQRIERLRAIRRWALHVLTQPAGARRVVQAAWRDESSRLLLIIHPHRRHRHCRPPPLSPAPLLPYTRRGR